MKRHILGLVTDFPIGECRIIDVDGRSVGVYNVAGRFHAVRNLCPHRSAEVCRGKLGGTMLPSAPGEYEYGMDNLILRCPWHGWEFNIETGATAFETDHKRLTIFKVTVEDGLLVMMTKA